MHLKKKSLETYILSIIYALIFLYFTFQEAILSPDSHGYLNAMPERSPGYVIFSKVFMFIFPKNYPEVMVSVQLLLGLFAVHFFLKRLAKILNLNTPLKAILLVLLLFPFFPPLLVANNICSEGLSYPIYLLFLSFGFEFLFAEKKHTLFWIFFTFFVLVLTRGQFVVTSIIFAFLFFFKNRGSIFKRKNLIKFTLVLLFPLITIFADKTYHKLKDGLFITTPFSFVAMSGAAFYVAKQHDDIFIEDQNHKIIFNESYKQLTEKGLLMTSNDRGGFDAYYEHFHNHVPQICNQTIHDISRKHYSDMYLESSDDLKAVSAFSSWQSELACKSIFFTLVKHNFKDWIRLFYSNIVHGFKSVVVLLFVIGIFLLSLFKVVFKPNKNYSILFVCSALTLSNAIIVSLACHSIMRYLFYNYILIFFMGIILIKLLLDAKRD